MKRYVLVSVFVICWHAAAVAAPPNIVLILADDMGYGDVAYYNAKSKIPTPHIDSIAREGIRFTDAHAAGPVCVPSRYGLLTGAYPFRGDMRNWRSKPVIAEGQPTIATILRGRGYQTAMVGKWHLGFAEDGYDKPLPGGPVDRGFDTFFGIRASTDIPPYFYIRGDRAVAPPTEHINANNSEGWKPIQGAFWREGGIAPGFELEEVLPRFTDEAVAVIERHAGSEEPSPLFLYLAYPAPHTPWLPTAEFEGRTEAGMYGDFVAMVDAMVGRVLQALEEADMREDTLLIFSSDNGPVWFDDDVDRLGHDSAGGLRGMKGDGYEAGHRIPFIVRWPGHVTPGSVSEQTICFTDVMATLAAVTGAEIPENAGPDSFSFLPVLLGRQPDDKPVRKSLVVPTITNMTTIRSGEWKLMTGLGSGGFTEPRRKKPTPNGPTGQLYNLANDLGETTNLFTERPEVVERLKAELSRIQERDKTRSTSFE